MPERSLALRITSIARLLRTRFDRRAREVDLTRAQWRTITCVRYRPGATQHEIACLLEVGDVTAGRSIDRLSDAGWVERRPDPADRRVYRIYLTSAATPVLTRLAALGEEEERIAFRGFNEAELAQLEQMLLRVWDNLNESASYERGGPQNQQQEKIIHDDH
jgi:MarR family transcriptional regulator for hemolysin